MPKPSGCIALPGSARLISGGRAVWIDPAALRMLLDGITLEKPMKSLLKLSCLAGLCLAIGGCNSEPPAAAPSPEATAPSHNMTAPSGGAPTHDAAPAEGAPAAPADAAPAAPAEAAPAAPAPGDAAPAPSEAAPAEAPK